MTNFQSSKKKNVDNLSKLEIELRYGFKNKSLLKTALNHSSNVESRLESNERLEFLGDRVLGLIISKLLYLQFPKEHEGHLAQRYASLVRAESLALVAETLNLAEYITLPDGDLEASSQRRTTILSDTCEALIAAVYLDGGHEAASKLIESYWSSLIKKYLKPPKDPKTELQEWAQKNKYPIPDYNIINQSGPDHDPIFTVGVSIEKNSVLPQCTAQGPSIRNAETKAAKHLLQTIKVLKND